MIGRFGEVRPQDELYIRTLGQAFMLSPVNEWASAKLLEVLEEECNRLGVNGKDLDLTRSGSGRK